jgi:uncharacterized repeat protein (TIGR01451 family)
MNESRISLAVVLLLTSPAALAEADLSVTATAVPLTVDPGASGSDLVDFTINVTNAGPDRADVIVTNALSAGLVIPAGLDAAVSQGFFEGSTGRWDVGFLSVGQVASLFVPARAITSASGCLYDRATAALAPGSGDTDPDRGNDAAQANIGAPVCADLVIASAVEQSRDGDCIDAEQRFSVTNRGPSQATTVKLVISRYEVTDPDNFAEDSCTTGQVEVPGPTTVTFGDIASGQTREYVTGLRNLQRDGSDLTIAYEVSVSAGEADPDAANSKLDDTFDVDRGSSGFFDGDGTACVVTNALRNSRFADELPWLRRWRDQYLMASAPGRSVVEWYRAASPALSALLDEHEWLRGAVRAVLVPLILALKHPVAAASFVLFALMISAGRTARRRGSPNKANIVERLRRPPAARAVIRTTRFGARD